jgi:hypothetical protein
MCLELGFDYFQGYYFARPVILSGKQDHAVRTGDPALLELINSDADNVHDRTAVKRDALISLNLLRLVNSRAAGPERRIESVAEALKKLGRKQLRAGCRSCCTPRRAAKVELNSPLLQLATTRGKLLELMSLQARPGDAAAPSAPSRPASCRWPMPCFRCRWPTSSTTSSWPTTCAPRCSSARGYGRDARPRRALEKADTDRCFTPHCAKGLEADHRSRCARSSWPPSSG